MPSMYTRSYSHGQQLVAFISALLLLGLTLAACGAQPTSGRQGTPTPGKTITPAGIGTPTPIVTTTVPLPTTQTTCPPAGTVRTAVMPPLALGNHPNIVYLMYKGGITPPYPPFTVNRYDFTTGRTTVMKQISTGEAQISADGQWLLFVAQVTNGQSSLAGIQLMRMDGQDLQTLYCSSTPATGISDVQWSPDQRHIIFFGPPATSLQSTLYLIDIVHGTVQPELVSTDPSTGYSLRTWIDNHRVYVMSRYFVKSEPTPTPATLPKLYILDTAAGANQQTSKLQFVGQAQSPYCWDFDSSYDTGKLFIVHCIQLVSQGQAGIGLRQGPSSITVQSATGGQSQTVYANPKQAIVAVRVVGYTSAALLFIIENQSDQHTTVDTSQNGLWKINTDGSGLTRLTTENAGDRTSLNAFTQYPWSNFSHDGSLYAARAALLQGNTPPRFSLIVGSISGGTPTTFATLPHPGEGAILEVVGWTSM